MKRRDQLIFAVDPASKDLSGSSTWGQERRNENVRVKDCAHSVARGVSHLVLRLNRQGDRFVLWHIVTRPDALEEVEAELTAQRILDHLAVAPARARCADLDRAEDLLVDGERGAYLRHSSHHSIMMRRRHSAGPIGGRRSRASRIPAAIAKPPAICTA